MDDKISPNPDIKLCFITTAKFPNKGNLKITYLLTKTYNYLLADILVVAFCRIFLHNHVILEHKLVKLVERTMKISFGKQHDPAQIELDGCIVDNSYYFKFKFKFNHDATIQ